jgi:hypothetical protein
VHSVRGVWTEDGVSIMETLTRNKNKGKTRIDWDLNIYCPEQWYGEESTWDPELWNINARIYSQEFTVVDTDYTITLLPKEAKAIGLLQHGKASKKNTDQIFDDWLDAGLDGFIDLHGFNELYRSRCSDRVLEFLDGLPQYLEDVPSRMRY